jgi:glycerol-3-phosphate dehydrogenase
MAEPDVPALIAPSQGIHLVFHHSFLSAESAIMVPHTSDGRVMFAIPWHGHTLVGTTDTPIDTPTLEPRPLQEEIDFILETASRYLLKPPTRDDVLSVFVGIRPLVKSDNSKLTAALSRDHTIYFDASGLMTTTGGKWTTYRNMAEHTIDQAADFARLAERPCVTRTLNVHGFHSNAERFGALGARRRHWRRHSMRGCPIPALKSSGLLVTKWHAPSKTCWRAARERCSSTHGRRKSWHPEVARLMGGELGWDAARQAADVESFRALARGYQL